MDQRQGRCDLHTHSQASDGMQPPADNVKLAKQKGLSAVALTDHDTVAGVAEAQQAGKEYDIDVVAGVEISTRAGGKDIHVLGYYVNTEDEQFLQRLRGLREARDERNHLIIGKLQELGLDISWQEVLDELGRPLEPDESIGRPHMADVLVKKATLLTCGMHLIGILLKASQASYLSPALHPRMRASGSEPLVEPL